MAKSRDYIKLGGRRTRRAGSFTRTISSAWLGADHLLLIESEGGFTEQYKRLYYSDIQAIFVRRTKNWAYVSFAFGFLVAIGGIFAAVTGTPFYEFWLIFGGFFLVLLAVHLLKGPTSQTFVQTAVQTEELPALNRIRKAKKHIPALRARIAAAQGTLAPEQVQQLLATGGQITVQPENPAEPAS
jgi:hypothetical protein